MLSATSLRKQYPARSGTLDVLCDVDVTLDVGDSAAIMGPSGSGKTTLLNILGTLEPPTAGSVRIDGTDPFALSPSALATFRNRTIGFVFQDHHLLPQCTVIENVLLPTLVRRGDDDAIRRAGELLERVGLSERLDHLPAELSGGERQRVAIARSLINQPRLLLADEPTGNLDRQTAETIADLLAELHRDQDRVLVVVTHSELLASRWSKRFQLIDGQLKSQ